MPLHPDFPIIEGNVRLTDRWALTLPRQFNRRMEEGNLVIWHPGLTVWLSAWGTEDGLSIAERVADAKANAAKSATDWTEETEGDVTRLSYSLTETREEGQTVYSLNAFAYTADGQVLAAFYTDDPAQILTAKEIAKSVRVFDGT
ncbi:MAG: hypothetical protein ACRBEQ_08585 [Hyphomonas sp.]